MTTCVKTGYIPKNKEPFKLDRLWISNLELRTEDGKPLKLSPFTAYANGYEIEVGAPKQYREDVYCEMECKFPQPVIIAGEIEFGPAFRLVEANVFFRNMLISAIGFIKATPSRLYNNKQSLKLDVDLGSVVNTLTLGGHLLTWSDYVDDRREVSDVQNGKVVDSLAFGPAINEKLEEYFKDGRINLNLYKIQQLVNKAITDKSDGPMDFSSIVPAFGEAASNLGELLNKLVLDGKVGIRFGLDDLAFQYEDLEFDFGIGNTIDLTLEKTKNGFQLKTREIEIRLESFHKADEFALEDLKVSVDHFTLDMDLETNNIYINGDLRISATIDGKKVSFRLSGESNFLPGWTKIYLQGLGVEQKDAGVFNLLNHANLQIEEFAGSNQETNIRLSTLYNDQNIILEGIQNSSLSGIISEGINFRGWASGGDVSGNVDLIIPPAGQGTIALKVDQLETGSVDFGNETTIAVELDSLEEFVIEAYSDSVTFSGQQIQWPYVSLSRSGNKMDLKAGLSSYSSKNIHLGNSELIIPIAANMDSSCYEFDSLKTSGLLGNQSFSLNLEEYEVCISQEAEGNEIVFNKGNFNFQYQLPKQKGLPQGIDINDLIISTDQFPKIKVDPNKISVSVEGFELDQNKGPRIVNHATIGLTLKNPNNKGVYKSSGSLTANWNPGSLGSQAASCNLLSPKFCGRNHQIKIQGNGPRVNIGGALETLDQVVRGIQQFLYTGEEGIE